jgi:pectate lyase
MLNTILLKGQTPFEAAWPCDSVSGGKCSVTGTGSALDETLNNLTIADYKGLNSSQRVQPAGGVWPADVSQDSTRYIQFSVTPLPSTVIAISSIELNVGSAGGSNMNVYIAYSDEPMMAGASTIYMEQMGKNTIQAVNAAVNIIIKEGKSLYLRFYPWYAKGSSSGKYLCLNNIKIKGVTGLSGLPVLTTNTPINIFKTTAQCGGNISADGGYPVTKRGVCWGLNPAPDISGDKTEDGAGAGSFTSSLTNLAPASKYYARAYATNQTGTAYGAETSFTTLDAGIKYPLSISVEGNGTVTASTADTLLEPGTQVTLTAVPKAGSEFFRWNGSITGDANPAAVIMDGAKNIRAAFMDANLLYPASAPVGFADAIGAGLTTTTGGAGGDTVYCKEGESVVKYLSNLPRTIVIEGLVTGGEIKGYKNLSIIGKGKNASLQSLAITNSSNIIVRNITLFDSPDGIRITTTSSNTTHHIWIDHCTFTDSPAIDSEGNSHDGLLDITHRSSYVTVSWCHFYNHRKTCLLGYSANATDEREPNQLMVTYHHNWFDSTNSRHPRARWAPAHVFNNVYSNNPGYGIGSTCGAHILAEANYFENVKTPILISQVNDTTEVLSGDPVGYVRASGNMTVNSGIVAQNIDSANDFNPSVFYKYAAEDAAAIADMVKTFAGAGKLKFLESQGPNAVDSRAEMPVKFELFQNYPNPFNPVTNIAFNLPAEEHVTVKLFDLLGREVRTLVNDELKAGMHTVQFNAAGIASGVYFYKMQAAGFSAVRKLSILK